MLEVGDVAREGTEIGLTGYDARLSYAYKIRDDVEGDPRV